MVDQLLGGLFGGQETDDVDQRRTRARDFVSRYQQGRPHEGYSDQEVLENYRQVERSLPPQDFEDAATEAFGRLSPEERREFRRSMRERSGGRFNVDSDDPRDLARVTSRFRQEQQDSGGGLASLFGFGGGGGGAGDLVSASRDEGGLLDSPVAKAALAGIAAMAMKKVIDSR